MLPIFRETSKYWGSLIGGFGIWILLKNNAALDTFPFSMEWLSVFQTWTHTGFWGLVPSTPLQPNPDTVSVLGLAAMGFMIACTKHRSGRMALIIFIVFIEKGQRRLIVQYPKRQVGNKIFSGDSSHLPLKINVPGVIPPIFASALLLLPTSVSSFAGIGSDSPEWLITINSLLGRGQPIYLAIYIGLIVFFAFFYTAIVFNPDETADNLKRNGGFVPGIRPGPPTADYLDFVLTRLTAIGALYLSAVCILPEILISKYSIPFYFGGTSLLIVVTVAIDTVTQAQSHMLAHQYSGLIKKRRLGGYSR